MSNFLNLSRWLAAFLVVFSHARSLVLVDYPAVVQHPGLLVRAVYFLGGFGRMSVVVFFVISGYLVGGRTLLKVQNGSFSASEYWQHRFIRIYLVLIPALVVGLLLDRLGLAYFDGSDLYSGLSRFHCLSLDFSIAGRLGLFDLAGNLAMLQTIAVPPLGSNGPLWSLANEWWYYVLFGFAVQTYVGLGLVGRFACGALLLIVLWKLPIWISAWFSIWLIGALLAFIRPSSNRVRWVASLACLLVVLVAERLYEAHAPGGFPSSLAQQFVADLVVAIAFSFLLLCTPQGHFGPEVVHARLAAFSYSLYLVHFPALVFVAAVLRQVLGYGVRMQPTYANLSFLAALVVALYLYASVFARMTESQTETARRWVRGLLAGVVHKA